MRTEPGRFRRKPAWFRSCIGAGVGCGSEIFIDVLEHSDNSAVVAGGITLDVALSVRNYERLYELMTSPNVADQYGSFVYWWMKVDNRRFGK